MPEGADMRAHRHRKLTDAMLRRLREQARLHAEIVPYPTLACECGITHGSLKQLMAQLIAEEREGRAIVRRGTNPSALEDALMELRVLE